MTRTWRRARRSSPIWLLDEGGAGVRVGESCCPSLSEARSVRPHPVVSPAGAHGDTSIDRLRAEIRYTERGHREPFPRWHLPRPTRTRDAPVHAHNVVLFQEPEGSSDIGLVDAMRPHDYSGPVWRFVVERHARRLFNSPAFDEAFSQARARIEQQLAEA
jgi:hypothetical protein